jgi:hypothetical protein
MVRVRNDIGRCGESANRSNRQVRLICNNSPRLADVAAFEVVVLEVICEDLFDLRMKPSQVMQNEPCAVAEGFDECLLQMVRLHRTRDDIGYGTDH